VEPTAAAVPGLTTLDLDALPRHCRGNLPSGFAAARETVCAETASYLSARAARQVGDLLGALTARAEQVRLDELARVRGRLSEAEQSLLEDVTRRLASKLLHPALSAIRDLAATGELTTANLSATLLGEPDGQVSAQPRIAG
jgi:glutamyl-tRNA reductase